MATAERLRAQDVSLLAAAFGRLVHDAGIPCSAERSVRFARALQIAEPTTRAQLYWTARTVFVSAREHADEFDRLFALVFDGVADPAGPRGDQGSPPLQGTERGEQAAPPRSVAVALPAPPGDGGSSTPSASGEEGPAADARPVALALAAAGERLADKDFAELQTQELLALRRLMRTLLLATPLRRTRRARRARRGERLDVRATLRAAHRTGGDPVRQVRRRRLQRPRPLVVLCDISGSMEPYSRAFLQFLHAAVVAADAEAFVFATRLTRLTRPLRGRQPDLAIARAAAAPPDWSGGTQIGLALKCFNDRHGRRGLARGAVIVIVSDGWERGEAVVVGREMERLRRLAHRVIWVNPRKAAPGFVPETAGMKAALPFCDAFVGGHSVTALSEVIAAIGAAR